MARARLLRGVEPGRKLRPGHRARKVAGGRPRQIARPPDHAVNGGGNPIMDDADGTAERSRQGERPCRNGEMDLLDVRDGVTQRQCGQAHGGTRISSGVIVTPPRRS